MVKLQALRRARDLLERLEQVTEEPGDIDGTLHHIARTAQTFFAADEIAIFPLNPVTSQSMRSITIIDAILQTNITYSQPVLEALTQRVFEQGVLLVEDLEEQPDYQAIFPHAEKSGSLVVLPLLMKYQQKSLGVFYLKFRKKQQFDLDDHNIFHLFADQASFILQETWLLRRYQAVANIGKEINHEFSTVEVLFQKLQKYIASLIDVRSAFLLAVSQPQSNLLDLYLEEQGCSLVRLNDPLEGACRYVIETQEVLKVEHMSKEEGDIPFKRTEIKGTEAKESLLFVPLILRDVTLGVLSIQHPQPYAFQQEDLFILQLLANYVALALHNIRLFTTLNRLNEAGQSLTLQLDSVQVLQSTVNTIREATDADIVVLYPYETVLQRFILPPRVAGTLLDPSFPLPNYMPPDVLPAYSLQQTNPIFAKDAQGIQAFLEEGVSLRSGTFQEREKISSTAVMPLRAGDEAVGVLFVNFRQPQRFAASQKLFVEGLAHYAAIAIKNAQAFDSLSLRRVHELEILQKIDRELSSTLELNAILNTLLRLACEHIPAEEASILLHDVKENVLWTAAAIGQYAKESLQQTIPLQDEQGITRWVFAEKKPARVDNVYHDQQWSILHIPVANTLLSELDIPLIDGEKVIGVLNFESVREASFSQEDQDFLVTLSGQAVLAIKNAQVYEREKRLAAEAQVIDQISKEIISQLDPTDIFNLILEKALDLTHSSHGNLMIYDPHQHDLWMAAERGVIKDKVGIRQSLKEGIVGQVARTKEALNIDLSQQPWRDLNLNLIPGARSELAVPMLVGEDLQGVLNIESFSANYFTDRDERLLKALADLAMIALQNARAYEREKRLVAEAQVLNQISREIVSQLDTDHIFDLILKNALKLTNSSLGSLHLYNAAHNDLWVVAENGAAEEKQGLRQKLGEGVLGWAAEHRKLVNVGDVSKPPWNSIYIEVTPDIRSELVIPMLEGDQLRGVLNVESPSLYHFDGEHERLLQGLVDLAVIALHNAQAYEREKQLVEEARIFNAEAQVLNQISREIVSQLDTDHVFDLILENALKLTDSTLGSLHLYDADRGDLWMATESGIAKEKKGQRQKPGEGVVGWVAQNRRLLNIEDVSQPPWNSIYIEFNSGIHSELALPMLEGDQLRGVLNVESPSLCHFNKEFVRLLQGLADLAVVALQNAEHYQNAEDAAQRFELLYQAGQELSKITDLEQLEQAYDVILHIVEKHRPCQIVLRQYNAETQKLVVLRASRHQSFPPFRQMDLNEGLNGHVARELRTFVIHDTHNLPPRITVKLSDPETHSLVIVPVKFKEQYYGNLALSHREIAYFRGPDVNFFEGLADQLAGTIYRLETTYARQESEQRAQAAEEMSSIGQSAFEVTHRLGNDLGLVEYYLRGVRTALQELDVTDTSIAKNLDNVEQSVQKVLSFSRDLKQELAKLGEEPTVSEPILIAPHVLLEKVISGSSIPSTIQIELDIDDDVATVEIIYGRVDAILQNLVANAIQAMPKGGKLTLRAHNSGRAVALDVIDTGIGISEEKVPKIFELFFSTKGSSGFGLWSARHIALKNHGDLKVKSQLGLGTIFTLLLPKAAGGMP